jgi:uncharacterized lipoprotein YmbA
MSSVMSSVMRFMSFILLVLLAACASTEPLPKYYVLTRPLAAGSHPAPNGKPRVFVRQPQVPAYLMKTSLASAGAGNQIEYSKIGRWAEPLDQAIPAAIADNLNRMGISAIAFQPSGSDEPGDRSYDLVIRISRFQGERENGTVLLSGTWQLYSMNGSTPLRSRTVTLRLEGWQPGDDAGLAELLSQELETLSGQIASALSP